MLFFSFYLLMPVLPFYLTDYFKVTNAHAGLVIAAYVAAAIMIRPFAAFIADSFDRKIFYFTAYFTFVIFYAGYIAASALAFFVIIRTVHGLAFGSANMASNTIVIDLLPFSRQGEGLGYFGVFNNIAMALGPVLGLLMYERFDFTVIFYSSLAAGSIGCIFALLVKAPRIEKVSHDEPLSFDRFLLLSGLPVGLNLLLLAVPYGMITTYIAMYGKHIDASSSSGIFFVLMAVGLIISRLFAGKRIDKGKIIQIIRSGIFMASFSLILLFFADKVHAHRIYFFYFTALLLGLSYGMVFPAFNVMFVNLAPHNRRATANSTYLTSWDLGIAAGIILGGKIIDMTGIASVYAFGSFFALIAGVYFMNIITDYFGRRRLR
ncbi:MAG: MFS transporter [Endomicrobia bacterium]|nr:MFS transporter [Endomicrobiia bacterium]